MIHGEISIYLLARLRRKYLAQLWKIVFRLHHSVSTRSSLVVTGVYISKNCALNFKKWCYLGSLPQRLKINVSWSFFRSNRSCSNSIIYYTIFTFLAYWDIVADVVVYIARSLVTRRPTLSVSPSNVYHVTLIKIWKKYIKHKISLQLSTILMFTYCTTNSKKKHCVLTIVWIHKKKKTFSQEIALGLCWDYLLEIWRPLWIFQQKYVTQKFHEFHKAIMISSRKKM